MRTRLLISLSTLGLAACGSGQDTPRDGSPTGDAPGDGPGDAPTSNPLTRTIGNEWFVEDLGAAAAPAFGFTSNGLEYDNSTTGSEITVTHTATGGPQDRAWVRQTIDNTSLFEFGAGWRVQPANWGGTMYVRFSFRVVGHYNQTQKLFMLSPGTQGGRSIIVLQPWDGGYVWRMAIDGGLSCQTDGGQWNGSGWETGGQSHTDLGQWSDIQVELAFSSAPGAPDGGYKIWRNNNAYDNPDCVSSGHAVKAPDADSWITWAGYHQGDVAGQLPRTFDHADLRIGPTFDASWHLP